MLVQRNLGANAGLDYKDISHFLTAIYQREEAELDALLNRCNLLPSPLENSHRCEALAQSVTTGMSLEAHRQLGSAESGCSEIDPPTCSGVSAVESKCRCTFGALSGLQEGEAVCTSHQLHVPPDQQCCCHSAARSGKRHYEGMSASCTDVSRLWRRYDTVAVVLCELHGKVEQAAALQHLLNLRRAGLVLQEVQGSELA